MENLVRFDWAIKKLLRNKANFDVLEGFLSELLGYDIKIEQILESESNKTDEYDKFNRVDILARTSDGQLMLIEVQNDPEIDFIHRVVFGVSKLITEYLREGDRYGSIQKIVSISIVYFQVGVGKDYLYECKGDFVGRHTKEHLEPNHWQKKKYNVEKISEIMPRYFLLKVNNFDKIAENTIDQWIHFLKNGQIPEKCTAKGLKEAGEKLRVEKLSDSDKKIYQRFKENRWIEKSVMETAEMLGMDKGIEKGIEKGMEKGMEKGKAENKLEVVKNAVAKGLDDQLIADITGLAVDQVSEIRKLLL